MAKINRKIKNLIIALIVLAVTVAGVFVGIRYYNGVKEFSYQSGIYNEDNFSDLNTNNIMLLNHEGDAAKVIPGKKTGFDINFKNNGALAVSGFRIILKVPEHLKFSGDIRAAYKHDFSEKENTIILSVGSLKSGESGSLEIKLEAE